MRCIGNGVLILKQWFGFCVYSFQFSYPWKLFCCHENVLTEMLATKQPRSYCWLRYLKSLPKCCLANGHIPSQYVYELQASKCCFFHVISGRNMALKGYILVSLLCVCLLSFECINKFPLNSLSYQWTSPWFHIFVNFIFIESSTLTKFWSDKDTNVLRCHSGK
jgi:hypothetical protein